MLRTRVGYPEIALIENSSRVPATGSLIVTLNERSRIRQQAGCPILSRSSRKGKKPQLLTGPFILAAQTAIGLDGGLG